MRHVSVIIGPLHVEIRDNEVEALWGEGDFSVFLNMADKPRDSLSTLTVCRPVIEDAYCKKKKC